VRKTVMALLVEVKERLRRPGGMMQRLVMLGVFTGVLTGSRSVAAQSSVTFTQVGECALHFGNFMVVDEHRAFITTMEGLDIVDVTDPRRPVLRESLTLGRNVFELARAGDHLYLQAGELQIVDLIGSGGARLVGTFGQGNRYAGLAVNGTRLHTVIYDRGLEILDVRDPVRPVPLGRYSGRSDGGYFQVLLKGEAAYLAHLRGGLEVLDLSDPTVPVRVETVPETEAVDDPSHPPEMNNRLCESLVSGDLLIIGTRTALLFYDLNEPLAPRYLSTLGGFDDWSAQIHKLMVADDLLVFCHGDDGIVAVNIADPRSPRIVGGMREPVHDMYTDGEYLYSVLLSFKVFAIGRSGDGF